MSEKDQRVEKRTKFSGGTARTIEEKLSAQLYSPVSGISDKPAGLLVALELTGDI